MQAGEAAFVGRGREIDRVRRALDAGDRLFTIVGPAGVGKTTLARRVSRLVSAEFPHRALLELGHATTPFAVCEALARALGIEQQLGRDVGDAVEVTGRALAARGRSLVVLDTFEHLVASAAFVVACWADLAPSAVLLVTSRERLGVPLEAVVRLEALSLPSASCAPSESDAVRLFVARARAVSPAFALTPENEGDLAALVARLDGLPLALELCAARAGTLSPRQMLTRLSSRFELLRKPRSRGSDPHETLHGAIDWSWRLLDAAERSALSACAIFPGAFDVDAAAAVIPKADRAGRAVLDLVSSLVEKSMLRSEDGRLAVYDSVRDFALAELHARGRYERTALRFARFTIAAAHAVARAASRGDIEKIGVLERDHAAIAASVAHVLALGPRDARHAALALEGAVALEPVTGATMRWREQGPMYDAVIAFAEAAAPRLTGDATRLARSRSDATRELLRAFAEALRARGALLRTRGEAERGVASLERALGVAMAIDDARLEARVRMRLGACFTWHDPTRATAILEEAMIVARRARDPETEADGLLSLATCAERRGDHREVLDLAGRVLAIVAATPAPHLEARARFSLSWSLIELGRYEEARRAATVGLASAVARRRRDHQMLAHNHLGLVSLALGDTAAAEEHLGAALALSVEIGHRWYEAVMRMERALPWLAEGRAEEARAELARSLERARELGDQRYEGVMRAWLGVAEVSAGDVAAGVASLDAADVALAASENAEPSLAIVRLGRGHVELAAEPDAGRAAVAVRGRLDAARGSASYASSYDLRFAARLLELAAKDRLGRASFAPPAAPPAARLVVGGGGQWFELGGARTDLGRRGAMCRLLDALATSRIDAPGRPLGLDGMLAAGWPGERVSYGAGAARVYNTVKRLRQIGLADLLVTRDQGYLLDPAALVTRG